MSKVTQAAVILIAAVMLFGRHDVLWAFGAIFDATLQLFYDASQPLHSALLIFVLLASLIVVGGLVVHGVRRLAQPMPMREYSDKK